MIYNYGRIRWNPWYIIGCATILYAFSSVAFLLPALLIIVGIIFAVLYLFLFRGH